MMTFVTGSSKKFAEAAALIPGLSQRDIDLLEIQETSVDAVLSAKIALAKQSLSTPFFVEDVSLIFEAMAPFPGPFIKWFVRDLGNSRLAAMAQQLGNTKATAICTIGAYINKTFLKFEGTVHGHIVAPRGAHGFGWDAIFCPNGSQLTFAEMDDLQKQSYSMRAVALNAMKRELGL